MHFWVAWLTSHLRVEVRRDYLRSRILLEVHGFKPPRVLFRVHAVLAVVHRQSQVWKVARNGILASIVAYCNLNFLPKQLTEACACQFLFSFFNVIVACLNSRWRLAGNSDWISWLYLTLALLSFDLLQDARVFLSDLTVIDHVGGFESESLCRCALLLSSQVRHLQESAVWQSHDKTISLFKLRTSYENWGKLRLGSPYKSHILVDQQKVVKRTEDSHEAGSFKWHFVLNLSQNIIFVSLLVLIDISSILIQMVAEHAAWHILKSSLVSNLPLVSEDEECLLAWNKHFFWICVPIVVHDQ